MGLTTDQLRKGGAMADSPLQRAQRAVDDGRARFCLPPCELGGSTHSHWLMLEVCEFLNIYSKSLINAPKQQEPHLHGGLNDKS